MDKIYWKSIKPTDKVILKGNHYEVNGKLVYWSGWESDYAQKILNKRAKR